MIEPVFHNFSDKHILAEQLATTVSTRLTEAITARNNATLILSGGSTPAPFLQSLNQQDLDWSKVTIIPADERWVMPDHTDSNKKLLRSNLVHKDINWISLSPAHNDESLEDGLLRIEQALKRLLTCVDVTILGMGEDGHTASLFPHHATLNEGLNTSSKQLCIAIKDSPKPPANRISLSAALLCSTQHMILHITGMKKKEAIEQALKEEDAQTYPIFGILNQAPHQPDIYWSN